MRFHLLALAGLAMLTGLLYGSVSSAYFCGFDDYIEMQRAAFEDARDPSRIWTTTHYESNKYRPLSRAMNDWSYWIGEGAPGYYRWRNLAFHWGAAAALYALGWLLFGSRAVAAAGAALFAVHPLANQAVNAAVFTNTAANAELLAALAFYIAAERGGRRRWLWLGLSMLAGALSLHTYDSSIMLFPLLLLWLALRSWQQKRIEWSFAVATAAGMAVPVGLYFGLRVLFVSDAFARTNPTPVAAGVKNLLLYIGVLLEPIDLVAAHDWWGAPLPSQIRIDAGLLAAGAVAALAGVALIRWGRARLRTLPWTPLVFLALAIPAVLAPFLLFTDHASETYVYLPAAFYVLGLSAVLRHAWEPRRMLFLGAVLLLGVNFAASTWMRNRRVAVCGEVADRILSSFPQTLQQGEILLANDPQGVEEELYGVYGYQGLHTIGVGEYGGKAVEYAFHLRLSDRVRVRVVEEPQLRALCAASPGAVCASADPDGVVTFVRD